MRTLVNYEVMILAHEVSLVNVTKKFGEVVAVNNLSLNIQEGEFVSILGPSGCGKTTTLRMIAGLTRPNLGKVYIDKKDVSNLPHYKRNIGMVFQDYALFPHMSVRDNIAFGLYTRKIPKDKAQKRVDEMLDLVQLYGVGDRQPNQLSGGQQQRVALARALAIEPNVLLLDEPLSNLDLKLRQEMRVELRRIQRKVGTTAIFVTHDQVEALALSDRIAVMNQGYVVQAENPVKLYEYPNTRFVASFLGDTNFFSGRIEGDVIDVKGVKLKPRGGIDGQKGEKITVIVRPEKIKIRVEPTNITTNMASGVVESHTYLGTLTRYYIQLEKAWVVIVDSVDTKVYPEGSKVILTWSVENCIQVKEEVL